jgi:hypothetical protein
MKTTCIQKSWLGENWKIIICYIGWIFYMYLGVDAYLLGDNLWSLIWLFCALSCSVMAMIFNRSKRDSQISGSENKCQ